MRHWREYLKGTLSRTIIAFLDEYFLNNNIFSPTIEQFLQIEESDLQKSWLSIPSMKEFQLFQQQLRNNESNQ